MHHADVVELVDTLDSGSSAREGMKVQVLSSALKNPVVRCRVFCIVILPSGGSIRVSPIVLYGLAPPCSLPQRMTVYFKISRIIALWVKRLKMNLISK